jgi:hypothetical protein
LGRHLGGSNEVLGVGVRKATIPSIIWGYWAQGFEQAPEIVHIAVESWKKHRGDLQIRLLDFKTLPDWLDMSDLPQTFDQLSHQKRANAIRLALLAKYGGIWLDSTVIVTRPLMPWVRKVQSENGLFFFQANGKDFKFTNWFIAAAPGHRFIIELKREYWRYFSIPRFDFKYGKKQGARFWFGVYRLVVFRPIRQLKFVNSNWSRFPLFKLPFVPFRIFHYLGNSLIGRDANHRAEFGSMSFVNSQFPTGAKGTHSGRSWELNWEAFQENGTPVNKLSKGDYRPEDIAKLRKVLASDFGC